MRVWLFDQLGGVASEPFDLHQNGQQLVAVVLSFLWISEEQPGFDPTITTAADGRRFIEIKRAGLTERLVIDQVMLRAPCVVGRATTCWRAHRK